MTDPALLKEMSERIRKIYRKDSAGAGPEIEKYIDQSSKRVSSGEKLTLPGELLHHFRTGSFSTPPEMNLNREELSRFFSLFLGTKNSAVDLTSPEAARNLAASLNTVFDTLNQIIGVINTTLSGKKGELETIRQVIGSNLEEGEGNSLQSYLNQIQEAFLVAHQAFQQAAQTKIGEILSELDPERIAASTGGGLRFGPLRKADLFDVYREKFQTCKGSFDSGRLMNDVLREFEKTCQKIYKRKAGEVQ
jgi:hypothetical protein